MRMSTIVNDAIRANLAALLDVMERGRFRAQMAYEAMHSSSNRNRAIGTILDLEQLLPEADALYRAVLLLHRDRMLDQHPCPS
jgi:hypothetical protein